MFKEWSRRLHEHEVLYLSMFLSLPGGDQFQECSGDAPEMLRGMLPEASRASLEFIV